MKLYDEPHLHRELMLMVNARGSPGRVAKDLGLHHNEVTRFLNGRPPTPKLIRALGYERHPAGVLSNAIRPSRFRRLVGST